MYCYASLKCVALSDWPRSPMPETVVLVAQDKTLHALMVSEILNLKILNMRNSF